MSEATEFRYISEGSIWIEASLPSSFHRLLPGQHHFNITFVCPECGLAWAQRVKVGCQSPTTFTSAIRRCGRHGDGATTLSLDFDLRTPEDFASLSHQQMEFLCDQYFFNPAVLTRDAADERYDR